MVKPDRPLATTVLAFVFAGVALFMEGCNGAAGPDLVAERRTGGTGAEGFCRRDDAGNLVVRVRNQSNADVLVQTTTVVVFSPGWAPHRHDSFDARWELCGRDASDSC